MLYGGDGKGAVEVLGREYHALGDEAVFELARGKVGHEEDLFAHELFGLVPLADATDDGPILNSVGNLELQEFLHLGHSFALEDRTHTDVELLEVLEGDGFLDALYSKCVPIMWDKLDYTLDLNHAHTVLFFFTFDGKK